MRVLVQVQSSERCSIDYGSNASGPPCICIGRKSRAAHRMACFYTECVITRCICDWHSLIRSGVRCCSTLVTSATHAATSADLCATCRHARHAQQARHIRLVAHHRGGNQAALACGTSHTSIYVCERMNMPAYYMPHGTKCTHVRARLLVKHCGDARGGHAFDCQQAGQVQPTKMLETYCLQSDVNILLLCQIICKFGGHRTHPQTAYRKVRSALVR